MLVFLISILGLAVSISQLYFASYFVDRQVQCSNDNSNHWCQWAADDSNDVHDDLSQYALISGVVCVASSLVSLIHVKHPSASSKHAASAFASMATLLGALTGAYGVKMLAKSGYNIPGYGSALAALSISSPGFYVLSVLLALALGPAA